MAVSRFSTIALIVASGLVTTTQLTAQTVPSQSLNLDSLIVEALNNNPQIRAARQRSVAAGRRSPQVSALPDPMVTYTRWLSSPETRVGPQQDIFMLSQPVPFPGKLGLMGDMADADAAAVGAQYEAARRDVVFNVKQAYYDLYWIDRSVDILDDYLSLLRDFSKVAEQKYATGVGIQASVFKSQVEISNITERRLSFERMRKGAAARLNALLNRRVDSPLPAAEFIDTSEVKVSEPLLVEQALAERQELKIAQEMVQKSGFMKDLARKEYLPNFSLQASYITVSKRNSMAPDAGKDAYSVGIGINLPIQLGRRVAAGEEAEATDQANRLAYDNLRNGVEAEIADLCFQLQSTQQTLDLYSQGLLVQAQSSLESAVSAYQTGKLDFLSLLDSERMVLQTKLGYVKELSNYRKIAAALQRAVGGNPLAGREEVK
jgi:cobalt-zinc-cadmium efflux system outer membrane protein